jgi:hypothetical protein
MPAGLARSSSANVRYKVKPDRIAENVGHIERTFAELDRARPAGIHYASFQDADGRFTHVAQLARAGLLQEVPAFRAFVASIHERCEEPPVTEEVTLVGSYGMFPR